MSVKEKINLRVDPERLALIDKAVAISGKSRTEFMTEASYSMAQEIILGRTIFFLDEIDIDYINDPNPEPDPKIVELFNRESRWSR